MLVKAIEAIMDKREHLVNLGSDINSSDINSFQWLCDAEQVVQSLLFYFPPI